MPAWIFDECRENQIPRLLERCKIDTSLLAAGSLILMLNISFNIVIIGKNRERRLLFWQKNDQ